VHVRAGGTYKRRPVVICVKGSRRDQEVNSARELEYPYTRRSIDPAEVGVCIISSKHGRGTTHTK
jgi:hypothetical protein